MRSIQSFKNNNLSIKDYFSCIIVKKIQLPKSVTSFQF